MGGNHTNLAKTLSKIDIEDPKELISKKLWESLIKNDPARGGRITLIVGEQGSGKTTAMLHLALIHLRQGDFVIWRGRPREQIQRLPSFKEKCRFWFWEGDDFKIYDVRGSVKINITEDLEISTYSNVRDLLRKIKNDRINVVYEPSTFYFDRSLKLLEVVQQSLGMKVAEKTMNEPQKPTYFWFELLYALIMKDNTYWYAVFLDECDELFPENPLGLQWKLQEFLKDCFKDLRKARVSLVASTHSLADIDNRIRSKIQFFIYMKNAKIPDNSVIRNKQLTSMLNTGDAIIENGLFGFIHFKKLKPSQDEEKMGDLLVEIKPKPKEEEQDAEDEIILEDEEPTKPSRRINADKFWRNIEAIKDDPESITKDVFPELFEMVRRVYRDE